MPPDMSAHKLLVAPLIDGVVIGDEAWTDLIPASGFQQVQPNDGQSASQKTEVYIGYSDTSLFIGVVAFDDNPAGIIVTDSRRDSSLDDTDAFLVIIDGLLDRQVWHERGRYRVRRADYQGRLWRFRFRRRRVQPQLGQLLDR
jgi:hypothetical protein